MFNFGTDQVHKYVKERISVKEKFLSSGMELKLNCSIQIAREFFTREMEKKAR